MPAYDINLPPSTAYMPPVIKSDPSIKNAAVAAISSGDPVFFNGTDFIIASLSSSLKSSGRIIGPGRIQLTWIWLGLKMLRLHIQRGI